ncbi:MAG: TonB family protein [Acidobacteriaceae bacterium]|nr:TonB family protein [Acidobacteriaceae bacterium]
MIRQALQQTLFAMTLAVLCLPANAQDGGNGSVLIRDGNGSATSNEDGGVRVSAAVMAAQIISQPDPDQLVARRMHLSGRVVVAIRVDKEGKVTKATAISGPGPLRDPALEAVRRWTYKPYLLNGQPVVVATTSTVMFYAVP